MGRSRGGFGTKVHLATCGNGVPLNVVITPGQAHECRHVARLLGGLRVGRRSRPDAVAGDRGYSYPGVRAYLRGRRIEPVIPTRSDQPRDERFDARRYRRRNVVERCVGWLKQCRRLATRYEKLAVNFLAFVKLAMIRRYLHLLFSDRT